MTAFGTNGVGGLDHYNALAQQNTDTIKGFAQQTAAETAASASIGGPLPSFTLQQPALDPVKFGPSPSIGPAAVLPLAAGGPAGATSMTTLPPGQGALALAPDALASPVTSPAIAAPPAEVDPFAPIGQGGMGLTPIGASGQEAFPEVPLAPEPSFMAAPPVPLPGFSAPPQPQQGYFARLGAQIGDNFATAFQKPLGPGPETRRFLAPATEPIGSPLDSILVPFNRALLLGVPAAIDGTARALGATYYSGVDAITGAVPSSVMAPDDAERLGRDLKAMPEAFLGSPGAFGRIGLTAEEGASRIFGLGSGPINLAWLEAA